MRELNISKNDLNAIFNNNYEIASKLELLKTKIFNENVLDKLEENFGIYLDTSNFIEELKSEIKIKSIKKRIY